MMMAVGTTSDQLTTVIVKSDDGGATWDDFGADQDMALTFDVAKVWTSLSIVGHEVAIENSTFLLKLL
jgi:hypothetical protein